MSFSLKSTLIAVSCVLTQTTFIIAGAEPDSASSEKKEPPVFERGSCFDEGYQPNTRLWGDAEYLLWWTKNAPVDLPLVTTGSVTDQVPGALGQPNTKILYGKHSIDNHAQSGFRLALRSWFGDNNTFGIEGSGFYLPKKSKRNFSKKSRLDGLPILGVPFNNVASLPLSPDAGGWQTINNTGEAALLAANGLGLYGSISVSSSTQLWGVELDGLFNFLSKDTFKLSALVGAVYIDLQDSLNLDFFSLNRPRKFGETNGIFEAVTISDKFRTHNEFYGGILGLRGGMVSRLDVYQFPWKAGSW